MPKPSIVATIGLLSALYAIASATKYQLQDNYSGVSFLDDFEFFTKGDPTNGYVNYVNKSVAQTKQMIRTVDGAQYIGVDYDTPLDYTENVGRDSVRIEGTKKYQHGLFIIDLAHMPEGCGTWPAFWSFGADETWPRNGEIDIIEGANLDTTNGIALHTDTSCKVSGQGQTGTQLRTDCALDSASSTYGCGVTNNGTATFGAPFNTNGGGVYAMEWTSQFIKMWFFKRDWIPQSIRTGTPDTSTFGTPVANLQGDCNMDSRFKNQHFIFDVTFCGEKAGNEYASSTCPQDPDATSGWQSCIKYVATEPTKFRSAYWLINYFKTFTVAPVVSSTSSKQATSSSTRRSSTIITSSTRSSFSTLTWSSTRGSSTARSLSSSQIPSTSTLSSSLARTSSTTFSSSTSSTPRPGSTTTPPSSSNMLRSSSGTVTSGSSGVARSSSIGARSSSSSIAKSSSTALKSASSSVAQPSTTTIRSSSSVIPHSSSIMVRPSSSSISRSGSVARSSSSTVGSSSSTILRSSGVAVSSGPSSTSRSRSTALRSSSSLSGRSSTTVARSSSALTSSSSRTLSASARRASASSISSDRVRSSQTGSTSTARSAAVSSSHATTSSRASSSTSSTASRSTGLQRGPNNQVSTILPSAKSRMSIGPPDIVHVQGLEPSDDRLPLDQPARTRTPQGSLQSSVRDMRTSTATLPGNTHIPGIHKNVPMTDLHIGDAGPHHSPSFPVNVPGARPTPSYDHEVLSDLGHPLGHGILNTIHPGAMNTRISHPEDRPSSRLTSDHGSRETLAPEVMYHDGHEPYINHKHAEPSDAAPDRGHGVQSAPSSRISGPPDAHSTLASHEQQQSHPSYAQGSDNHASETLLHDHMVTATETPCPTPAIENPVYPDAASKGQLHSMIKGEMERHSEHQSLDRSRLPPFSTSTAASTHVVTTVKSGLVFTSPVSGPTNSLLSFINSASSKSSGAPVSALSPTSTSMQSGYKVAVPTTILSGTSDSKPLKSSASAVYILPSPVPAVEFSGTSGDSSLRASDAPAPGPAGVLSLGSFRPQTSFPSSTARPGTGHDLSANAAQGQSAQGNQPSPSSLPQQNPAALLAAPASSASVLVSKVSTIYVVASPAPAASNVAAIKSPAAYYAAGNATAALGVAGQGTATGGTVLASKTTAYTGPTYTGAATRGLSSWSGFSCGAVAVAVALLL